MTYILGLCTMGNSAASLFKDGRLTAAVEEERLSRIKNDSTFPHKAIKEVLAIANISPVKIPIIEPLEPELNMVHIETVKPNIDIDTNNLEFKLKFKNVFLIDSI